MSDPWLPYSRRRHADSVADAPALRTDNLSVCYPGTTQPALRDCSLCIERGTRVALIGPNGAGKSTLLKAVAGLLPIASGQVRVYGNPVGACHHRVAYLPQRGEIDWTFPISVERLVLTGRYVHLGWLRWPGRRDRLIARAMLDRLGLGRLACRQIGRLSGGQQQRALLARALAQEADLLLLDEPLNAVDAETRDVIDAVCLELRRQGKTLLVATHEVGRLASAFDSAVYLQAGELAAPPDGACRGVPLEDRTWAS
jgi:manganese/zinc/iron transport system ATP- binding protein